MLILEYLSENRVNSRRFQIIFSILLIIVLILGVFDQVPASYALNSDSEREIQFLSDDSYFKSIESSMSGDSQIFILPDIGGFPESNPPGKIYPLDNVKPYLHTTALKWSYPTMKGRFWDNWQVMVASSPANEMLNSLYFTNFTGLLIDGYGYADGGLKTINSFETVTGVKPLVSNDGRYSFFDLRGYMSGKNVGLNEIQLEKRRDQYLNTIAMMPELRDPGYGTQVREKKLLQKSVITS
jgi:phosphoglycerol transferase